MDPIIQSICNELLDALETIQQLDRLMLQGQRINGAYYQETLDRIVALRVKLEKLDRNV